MQQDQTPSTSKNQTETPKKTREAEHEGPWWQHPMMLYALLTSVLFLFLIVVGWLALENDWIPKR